MIERRKKVYGTPRKCSKNGKIVQLPQRWQKIILLLFLPSGLELWIFNLWGQKCNFPKFHLFSDFGSQIGTQVSPLSFFPDLYAEREIWEIKGSIADFYWHLLLKVLCWSGIKHLSSHFGFTQAGEALEVILLMSIFLSQ